MIQAYNLLKDVIKDVHKFKEISPIEVKGKSKPIDVWVYKHK